jgi:hypothetical protein
MTAEEGGGRGEERQEIPEEEIPEVEEIPEERQEIQTKWLWEGWKVKASVSFRRGSALAPRAPEE